VSQFAVTLYLFFEKNSISGVYIISIICPRKTTADLTTSANACVTEEEILIQEGLVVIPILLLVNAAIAGTERMVKMDVMD
jgi:hypothetical protein